MHHWLFDMDGTLTDPRKPINEAFAEKFIKFCARVPCHVVTGSDYGKVQDQLGPEVIEALATVYACSGNVAYHKGREIWCSKAASWTMTSRQLEILQKELDASDFWLRTGNHIEPRTGSYNFSIVGRNADEKERGYYRFWDRAHGERAAIIERLRKRRAMKELEFVIGGETGIDIYPRGFSKAQVRSQLKGRVTFVGDKCEPGGNDYDIAMACDKFFHVKNWQETGNLLGLDAL